jgi:signal transduction histidine kinase
MLLEESRSMERVIAAGRAFMALASLLALGFGMIPPQRFPAAATAAILAYALVSFPAFLAARAQRTPPEALVLSTQALDVLWPAVFYIAERGYEVTFLVLFIFAVVTAAYRWRLRGAVASAAASVALLWAAVLLEPALGMDGERPTFHRLALHGAYLLILAGLVGYLTEQQKLSQEATAALLKWSVEAQRQDTLPGAMRAVFRGLFLKFQPRRGLLLLEEQRTGRAYVWEANPWRRDGSGFALTSHEMDSAERKNYDFVPPGGVWYGKRDGAPGKPDGILASMLDPQGRSRNIRLIPPAGFLRGLGFRSLLAVKITYHDEWSGHLILVDPQISSSRDSALRFLEGLAWHLSPVVYSVFSARQARSKAGAAERARVARELHDGVLQSLMGIEMQVDVLRRQAAAEPQTFSTHLGNLQRLLRQEVLNVRELMLQIRPLDVGPRQLVGYLANLVNKFGNDTGMVTNFTSSVDEVELPARVCHELARIAQEGLVNVRKHSQARHVVVSLSRDESRWKLVIDDDGRGFDFTGRLMQPELDAARKGPVVIKERVRAVSGELVVESRPGRGARLEITIQPRARG